MVDQVISDLQNAKAYLLLHGWHQGNYVPNINMPWKGQPACMTGAVRIAIDGGVYPSFEWSQETHNRFRHAMRTLSHDLGPLGVPGFNDAPQCIFEDVIRQFDKAIERRRATVARLESFKEGK